MLLTTIALVTAAASIHNARTNARLAEATLSQFEGEQMDDPNVTNAYRLCPWAKGYLALLSVGTVGAVAWLVKHEPVKTAGGAGRQAHYSHYDVETPFVQPPSYTTETPFVQHPFGHGRR